MVEAALVLMDLQTGVLNMVKPPESYFQLLKSTTAAARTAGLPIIFVKSCFRLGYPDGNPANKTVASIRAMGEDLFVCGSDFTEFHPDIPAREKTDAVVTKRRISALSGTDLEVVLKSLGVGHIVLAGVLTSGVVLSTVREAADLDYVITVLEDLCLDVDAEVQDVLMKKLFPLQGTVVTAEKFVEGLNA